MRVWQGPGYVVAPATGELDFGGELVALSTFIFCYPTFRWIHFRSLHLAAEVLTLLTGDEYFSGGKSNFEIQANNFLVFEESLSADMTLEWATYRDASDQCCLSRIWGGIRHDQTK